MRLKDKVAVIIGAGQNPGETIGNGRATALRFAAEGARILAVDRRFDLAEENRSACPRRGRRLRRLRSQRDAGDNTELGDGRSHAALGPDRCAALQRRHQHRGPRRAGHGNNRGPRSTTSAR